MPVQKKCEQCGVTYNCRPSKVTSRKYCSKECSVQARIKYPDIQDNPDALKKQYRKTFIQNNPARVKELDTSKFERYYTTLGGRATHMLNNARARARRKKIKFTLTKSWIEDKLKLGKCEVTDIPFDISINGGKGHINNPWAPSIDRIDQTGPYTQDNCRVTCWIYNRARGAFSDEDFTRMIAALS